MNSVDGYIQIDDLMKSSMVSHSPQHPKNIRYNNKTNILHKRNTWRLKKLQNIINKGETHTWKRLLEPSPDFKIQIVLKNV